MDYNQEKSPTGTPGQNMEKKKALKIDLDELCEAMENSSYENEYFFDLETGEISIYLGICG